MRDAALPRGPGSRMGRRRPPRHGRPKAWLGCWPRLVRAPCGVRTNVGLPLTPCAALARSLRRASLIEEHRESSYEVRRALFSLLLPRPAPSHGSCLVLCPCPSSDRRRRRRVAIVMTVRVFSCVSCCLWRGLRLGYSQLCKRRRRQTANLIQSRGAGRSSGASRATATRRWSIRHFSSSRVRSAPATLACRSRSAFCFASSEKLAKMMIFFS